MLRVSDDAKCDFKTLAGHWLDSRKHKLAESTAEWYGYFIKNLGNFFGAASIRNITAQDCERWAATRRKTVGTKSFVSELDTMNAVFKYAVRHGLILANPADPIERPTVRQPKIQVPSLEEFQQILATIRQAGGQNDVQNLSKIGANLVELLAYSGARVAEITGGRKKKNPLIWSNVNFESNMVFLPGTKTESSPRWIPMSGELRGFLERLKADKNPCPGRSDHSNFKRAEMFGNSLPQTWLSDLHASRFQAFFCHHLYRIWRGCSDSQPLAGALRRRRFGDEAIWASPPGAQFGHE